MTRAGAEVVEVSCPHFVHALATYYLILPAEASSNLARFDAMRYGLRVTPDGSPSAEDVMRVTREAGFGDEVKRRIILGTYALSSGYYDAYYGQAQKVRTLITRDFDAAFEQADVLVSPTAPTTAFRLGEKVDDPLAMYLNDLATIPANLCGRPGHLGAERPRRRGRPAGGGPDPRSGPGRRPRLPRRRRPGGAARARVGRPSPRPGPCACVEEGAQRSSRNRRRPAMTDPLLSYDDVLAQFDPALGLEVHVELNTATKMFCGCPTEFGAEPNTQTCPTCLGLPGSMPVVNAKAVESAIRIGLALNCEIAEWCRFARKNYFYPDMPKNFQTSQYDEPIAFEGYMDVEVDGETYRVGIERAHMEEDTGKSLHVGGSTGRIHGADYSLVDYNRAGIPLIEIVTKPVLGTGREGARGRPRLRRAAARPAPRPRRERRTHGAGVAALRRQPLAVAQGLRHSRHPHGDQERQLPALGRAGCALRDAAPRRGPGRRPDASSRRPGTGTRTPASRPAGGRSPTRRTTATSPSPTWCRWRRAGSGSAT